MRTFARLASQAVQRTRIPSKSFTTTSSKPLHPPRKHLWGRKIGGSLIAAGTVAYLYDTTYNDEAFTRSLRAIRILSLLAIDYKFNFHEAYELKELHARNADRLFYLLTTNKGLYVKMGQVLALQGSNFPPVYQEKFAQLFDNAPQDTEEQVRTTFRQDFGTDPEEIFDTFDFNCIASASIAQVYKATLKSGEPVAVKIQHANIRNQIYWDLKVYTTFMGIYGWLFNLPTGVISEYNAERIATETNFELELNNAETSRKFLNSDRALSKNIYIPQNYPQYSTHRILTSEWIDAIPLGRKNEIIEAGFDITKALTQVISFCSKQMFEWGCVHCDPHPGNIMLRRVQGKEQVVIIDHGLYVYETEEFKAQNCLLWKSMFVLDRETVKQVISEWGIGNADVFASLTMLKKYNENDQEKYKSEAEYQKHLIKQFQTMIQDVSKMPLILMLLGRATAILQGCNKMYGSPVNRVKIMATQASSSFRDPTLSSSFWPIRYFKSVIDHAKFRFAVFLMDTAFILIRIRQFFASQEEQEQLGFEAVIERQMYGG